MSGHPDQCNYPNLNPVSFDHVLIVLISLMTNVNFICSARMHRPGVCPWLNPGYIKFLNTYIQVLLHWT